MSLQPLRPGRWVNQSWQPGTAGTFAVVIGVSAYQHLDGSAEKFHLGQLPVSAATARRFLDWLEADYRRAESPLAKCWLLLSPTAAEIKAHPALSANNLEPSFDHCCEAIQEWFAEMAGLSGEAAVTSRSVFFFSGHGLEVVEDRQILLPSDYLRVGTPIDRALSTSNISLGLKALRVPTHFLFLDACRNDHDNLGQYTPLEGTKVLNEPANRTLNPDCMVPIFYGSGAGGQSFSPTNTNGGISLLGQALLEGLRGKGLDPDCKGGKCWVDLHILRPFVQSRIAEIVRTQYQSSLVQRVRVRGDQTEDPVTEVLPPTPQPGGGGPTGPPPLSEFSNLTLSVQPHIKSLRASGSDYASGHEFFGSERVTAIWRETARVYDFGDGIWLPKGEDFEISSLRRTADGSSAEFDFSIPRARPGATYWLQIEDDRREAFGCALPLACIQPVPEAGAAATRFRIAMDFEDRNRRISRFEVSLSPENHSEFYLDSAAAMWKLYDETSTREAEKTYDFLIPHDAEMLQDLMCHKYYSPFAATIAGTILIRARRWDRLKDWVRNLANIRPYGADAQVLWVEQCLRQPNDEPITEVLRYFRRLALLPLPFLTETIGHALRQADDLAASDIPLEDRRVVADITARLRRSVGVFRTGGMFATFAGAKEQITPDLVVRPAREVQEKLVFAGTEAEVQAVELPDVFDFVADALEAAEAATAAEAETEEKDKENDAETGV